MGPNTPFEEPPGGRTKPDIFNKVRLKPHDWKIWFQTFPFPSWIFEPQSRRFLEINEAATRLYGLTREEFLANQLTVLFSPEDAEAFQLTFNPSEEGFVRNGVWRQKRREGKSMDVELLSAAIVVGETPARLVIVNEVTERRWAEQMLAQVHAHTEHQLGARTMELDAAAQEMEGFAQFLQQVATRIPPSFALDAQQPLGSMLSKASEGLFELSRMSYLMTEPREFDLSEMVREIGDEVEKAHPERPISFQLQPKLLVRADSNWMRQALRMMLQYLSNLPDEKPIIHFGADISERETVFFLRQPGASFDRNLLDHLFLPLEGRLRKDQSPQLNLALVRRIIAKHSGRIWAENVPGRGVSFFFTLPQPHDPLQTG